MLLVLFSVFDIIYESLYLAALNNRYLKDNLYLFRIVDIFAIILIVFIHIERLDHPGKVCSGDYLISPSPQDTTGYLIKRGFFFFTLLLLTWIIIGIGIVVILGAIVYT